MPRVFVSAGEASGDTYAGALVEEMKRLRSKARPLGSLREEAIDSLDLVEIAMELEDEYGIETPEDIDPKDLLAIYESRREPKATATPIRFEGVGGKRLAAAGAEIVADSSGWGAISIAQALRVVPRVLPGYYEAKRALASGRPGLFIPIDFGYANIRLARHAKNRGWKVLYFMPPGSWRRDKQGKDLPQITDEVVTPFKWSAEILTEMGARAHWFGHPIKQLIRGAGPIVDHARSPLGIGVLPGSRAHEIELNLPVIAEALRGSDMRAEFAVAPAVDPAELREAWLRLDPKRAQDRFTVGDAYGVLARASVGLICSGTATLEAALCRCPMVVIYRLTPGMVAEARLLGLKRPKFISLPNILLDRAVVPELVHTELTPDTLRAELERIREGPARDQQLAAFEEIDALLGPADAITRAAELAISLLSD